MQYTFITPPASRAADRPPQIDDALIVAGRRMLLDALGVAADSGMSRRRGWAAIAAPMAAFCAEPRRRGVPVEKLIVALKLAWASLPELRMEFGDAAPDVIAAAVTACIQAYFDSAELARAD
jgi:hypothetical protein